jgi:hypothetical protein
MIMTKVFLALGAAAVALSATPAMADRNGNHGNRHHARVCAKWRHGNCVRWDNHGYRVSSARHAQWNNGYRFGPRYSYTTYSAIPRPIVSQYSLSPDYRYVYRDNYVYVVNPRTYAIERVIDALTR